MQQRFRVAGHGGAVWSCDQDFFFLQWVENGVKGPDMSVLISLTNSTKVEPAAASTECVYVSGVPLCD